MTVKLKTEFTSYKSMDDNDEHTMASCIWGYHVYKDIWSPYIGETLTCQRQPLNIKERYAVSVCKGRMFSLFLPRTPSSSCLSSNFSICCSNRLRWYGEQKLSRRTGQSTINWSAVFQYRRGHDITKKKEIPRILSYTCLTLIVNKI